MKTLIRFLNEEEGTTAIEYALIASLISIAAIGSMNYVSGRLQYGFDVIGDNLGR